MSWAWTEEKLGGLASKVLEMFGHISIIRLWCSGLSGLGPGWTRLLLGFGSWLWPEKERSAEICRAQKHCHLLTCPGTQSWTLPHRWSPFPNDLGMGHRLLTLLGCCSLGWWQGRTTVGQPH